MHSRAKQETTFQPDVTHFKLLTMPFAFFLAIFLLSADGFVATGQHLALPSYSRAKKQSYAWTATQNFILKLITIFKWKTSTFLNFNFQSWSTETQHHNLQASLNLNFWTQKYDQVEPALLSKLQQLLLPPVLSP